MSPIIKKLLIMAGILGVGMIGLVISDQYQFLGGMANSSFTSDNNRVNNELRASVPSNTGRTSGTVVNLQGKSSDPRAQIIQQSLEKNATPYEN